MHISYAMARCYDTSCLEQTATVCFCLGHPPGSIFRFGKFPKSKNPSCLSINDKPSKVYDRSNHNGGMNDWDDWGY